ncbi:hypothetical protein LS684_18370 [Cytobacillus spongiae]|uniref:hypothetical protein n=1 Tax=Cytobacillus spongiae TaxID=2901381 RepID=UPI001F3AB121|nr:hypothetical protein [Cytobacillus spongiae]UII55571.1 hypothetical protein LS684_18370 [Cytobacillus spongiae]
MRAKFRKNERFSAIVERTLKKGAFAHFCPVSLTNFHHTKKRALTHFSQFHSQTSTTPKKEHSLFPVSLTNFRRTKKERSLTFARFHSQTSTTPKKERSLTFARFHSQTSTTPKKEHSLTLPGFTHKLPPHN